MKKYLKYSAYIYLIMILTATYMFAHDVSLQANTINLSPKEKVWIKSHPIFRVHNEMNWAPFNYNLNGVPKGFSIDYMNLLAKKLGLKLKYIHGYTWDEFLKQIKDKKIDIILNIIKTKNRQKYILFTENYYISNPMALVLRKDENINNVKDLFGKTVAITKGFYYGKLLRKKFPKIKLLEVDNDEEGVLAVSTSRADAAFGKLSVENYYIIKNTINNIKLVEDRWLTKGNTNTKDYIGVRKDWSMLQKILDKAMSAVTRVELNKLKKKWSIIDSKNDKFKESLDKKEKEWIKKHPVIHFVINPSKEPFEYIDKNSGKFDGIEKDYINILGDRTGIKFELIKTSSWKQSVQKIQSKEADMYSSASKTPDKLKIMNFSSAYLSYPLVLVTQNNKNFLTALDSLDGKKVAVIEGQSITKYLEKNYKKLKKIHAKTLEIALRLVSEGKAYALISSLPIVSFQMNKYGYNDLKISGRLDFSLPSYIALRKDWGKTGIEIINKALRTISKEKKEEIYNKHINIVFENSVDYRLVWKILAIAFIVLLVILLWVKKLSILNHKINEQKIIFKSIYEKAFDAIFLIEKGRIVDCNKFAVQVFGFEKKEDILSASPAQLSPKYQPDFTLSSVKSGKMIAKTIQKGYNHFEWVHIKANGEEFWTDIALTKIEIDKKDIIHVRLIDIQGVKEAKREATEAKEKALLASKYKSEFLANMSHEIRTPMNAILGFAELIGRDVSDLKLKSYAKTIQTAGETLLILINDILDLSKIEAGKLTLNYYPVNIDILFNNIIEIFILKAQEKNISLICDIDKDIPQTIILDEIRLRQILLNLVGNSIKFTNRGFVKLKVRILSTNDIDNTINLCISIEDTGRGIKKDELESIFESFTQQSGQSIKEYGGTGLGLSISKKLVKMMGGDIKVKSIEHKGTTFEVRIYNIKKSFDKHIEAKENNIKLIEAIPKKKSFKFSKKTRENITAIRTILDKEILPLQSKANNSNDIHEINEFVAKVGILAKKYDIDILQEYVKQINKSIIIFDVKKIKNFLKKFIDIEKTLL